MITCFGFEVNGGTNISIPWRICQHASRISLVHLRKYKAPLNPVLWLGIRVLLLFVLIVSRKSRAPPIPANTCVAYEFNCSDLLCFGIIMKRAQNSTQVSWPSSFDNNAKSGMPRWNCRNVFVIFANVPEVGRVQLEKKKKTAPKKRGAFASCKRLSF